MLGKKILSENFNSKSVTLNVSNISQGFYIIKTTTKTQKFENKITIISGLNQHFDVKVLIFVI